jgi:hydrophobic/amphiphilic exporter-1 (mainly G- bacteria), HAE1 family
VALNAMNARQHESYRNGKLMLAPMLVGSVSLYQMRREVFPEFELEVVMVTVPIRARRRGCRGRRFVRRSKSDPLDRWHQESHLDRAGRAPAMCLAELRSDVATCQKVMSEIDREVNRIPSFPALAEDPQVQQITFPRSGDSGRRSSARRREDENAELRLREVAEEGPRRSAAIAAVSRPRSWAVAPTRSTWRSPKRRLREYGLSLEQVAAIMRERNVELPGGQSESPKAKRFCCGPRTKAASAKRSPASR